MVQSFDNNTKTIKEYDKSVLVFLELDSTLGLVNTPIALINEEITYTPSQEGNGTVTARHLNAYYTITIENSKIPTVIKPAAESYEVYVDDTCGNLAVLQNEDGNNITEEYTLTYTSNNESVVKIVNDSFVAVGEGSAVITVSFNGTDRFAAAESKTIYVTVKRIPTEIVSSAVTTVYNVDKNLVITLKDVKGNSVSGVNITVDLNGAKTYTTDKNGQVKVPTKGLVPKAYTAKVTFDGNAKYVNSSKNVKVTVKKAASKIVAKSKTFKTITKTKKYAITLKNNIGKPISKAVVYLKVAGKTYKATTNSKGKATFKITKLNKKGNFKATVTFKGNKYYKKVTKKVTIKVKQVWKTVSKGSKESAKVKKIQRALKNNGYYLTYQGHYLKVDGIYWDCTVRSVKEFQHDKGLKVTGKVDEKTALKLGLI